MLIKIYKAVVNQFATAKGYVIGRLKGKLRPFYSKISLKKKSYRSWIAANEPDPAALAAQCAHRFDNMPNIAVVCTADIIGQASTIAACLKGQTYARWRLYYLCGCAAQTCIKPEDNILLIDSSLPPDEIIALIHGDVIVTIGQDTLLCPFALYEIANSINCNPGGKLFYCDEDSLIDATRCNPHFKPDNSPDTLRSFNYIGSMLAIKREVFVEEFTLAIANTYALALKYTQDAGAVVHIRKILYHTVGKGSAIGDETEALCCHLESLGVEAVIDRHAPGLYNIIYKINGSPRVSIIIPNKDNALLLKACVKSITDRTAAYDNYDIVIVENGSTQKDTYALYDTLQKNERIKIINWSGEFNYASVNNYAAAESDGAMLLFLNNDIEAVNADWLINMLRHALRRDVGAVGAKLYYPDGTIQHAGIVVGVGGIAVEYHKGFKGKSTGYFNRLNIVHNVAAVTGACLMLKRELFEEAGGFDQSYALAYNDVDLCLRLMEMGYRAVWTPFSQLIHRESTTRGYEITQAQRQRLNEESARFTQRWRHILNEGDPFYNPNLSRKKADFTLC